jgi:hypothetical protein
MILSRPYGGWKKCGGWRLLTGAKFTVDGSKWKVQSQTNPSKI